MSDGSLSQDEIDALLQGTDNIEMETAENAPSPLSNQEKTVFQNLLKDIVESQGSNLSILTGKTVTIGAPEIKLVSREQFIETLPEEIVDVKIDLTEGVVGDHSYFLTTESANTISSLMMGQTGNELDEAALSAVSEAVSQMTGSAATAIGNQIGRMLKTSPPDLKKHEKSQARLPQGDVIVSVEYPFSIEGETPSKLYEVFALSAVKDIASLAGGASAEAQGAETMAADMPGAAASQPESGVSNAPFPGNIFGEQGGGMQQTFGQSVGGANIGPSANPPNVQPVQFANLQPSAGSTEQGNIGLLMDVYMEMTVELGRTKKLIKDILGIGEGTIIELDKLAGEPVDILVNHKLIAKGEVVVIDENFGVRVTEIVSPMERMSDLS
ncbi:MAG: flagellar motor switch phosphatase FliY [Spirochaetales bacterium]|nr:flagellar motor switch phosphatase FliY [Spirochaetales bacterium]